MEFFQNVFRIVSELFQNCSRNVLEFFYFNFFFPETEVPSAPEQPTVTDTTPTEATLSWEDGGSDGGSPITGYNVYVREKGTKPWKKVTKSVIKKRTHVLTELTVDKEYEAQITAVNDVGESEPSEASTPFKLTPKDTKKAKASKDNFSSRSKFSKSINNRNQTKKRSKKILSQSFSRYFYTQFIIYSSILIYYLN